MTLLVAGSAFGAAPGGQRPTGVRTESRSFDGPGQHTKRKAAAVHNLSVDTPRSFAVGRLGLVVHNDKEV
jgi:hypothetical protein